MANCCSGGCAPSASGGDTRFRRLLWWALGINALMFGVEVIAGLLAHSLALQADALDFLGDAANYAISLAVLGLGLRTRARAALLKGISMGLFGLWVAGNTVYRLWGGELPEAAVMGAVSVLALAANVGVALMLYRFRNGDSNMQSVWICSRNDAIVNLAVLAAAAGVGLTGTRWPDLAVAAVVATLAISGAWRVLASASHELRHGHRQEIVDEAQA
jgi:Co/Zn/Cd efflux system component